MSRKLTNEQPLLWQLDESDHRFVHFFEPVLCCYIWPFLCNLVRLIEPKYLLATCVSYNLKTNESESTTPLHQFHLLLSWKIITLNQDICWLICMQVCVVSLDLSLQILHKRYIRLGSLRDRNKRNDFPRTNATFHQQFPT